MDLIMGSQNIMGSDYGSNISDAELAANLAIHGDTDVSHLFYNKEKKKEQLDYPCSIAVSSSIIYLFFFSFMIA
jgi:hypothetical protein